MNLFKYKSRLRNTIYHFKVADFKKLKKYSKKSGLHYIPWSKMIKTSWLTGASFEDYYELRFFKKTFQQQKEWITTSLRHELTRQVNDSGKAIIFKDKMMFAKIFNGLLGREIYSWSQIQQKKRNEYIGPMVLKPQFGQTGIGIFFAEKIKYFNDLSEFIKKYDIDPNKYIFETYIADQHLELKKINPNSLNTLRIVTFFDGNNVEIWGCTLRIGINSKMDSVSAGGLHAWVQLLDGVINRPASSIDPFDTSYFEHPETKQKIVGIKIPFWDEVINLVTKAAKIVPEVKSVGWDVALKEEGPCLIEGNDNWSCKSQSASDVGCRYLANSVTNMKMVYN